MLEYLTAQADWADHLWETKTDRTQIDEIQAMVNEIAARGGLA
jgi:hypothetical protein